MSFLRRALGGDRAPDWASFMSGGEFRAFIDELERQLTRRGQAFRIEGDGLFIERDGDEPLELGLLNLAQLCHQLERRDWPVAIETHLRAVEADPLDDDALDDAATALPLLKARIYPVTQLPPEALDGLVTMPLTPDLAGVLVVDLPATVRTLARSVVRTWPEPVDRLFEIALEHLADEIATYEREELALEGGATVTAWSGPSFFVASQVLRLGELIGSAPNGALVAIPTRHSLLVHRIDAARPTLAAITTLLPLAARLHREGPGSISPLLHWWHAGALTPLPSTVDGRRIDFAPPDAFNELLMSLEDQPPAG